MLRTIAIHALVNWRYFKQSFGHHRSECTVCGYEGRFFAFGSPPRYNARCLGCGCLERQRLVALADKERKLFEGKRVLHFAPERQMRKYLQNAKAKQYVTADLFETNVDVQQDIENLTLPEKSFDVIVCSHVLEHVDDRKALAQMYKVLDKGGVALLMTPIIEGWDQSYENSDVKSEADRIIHFGQRDHVRYFGRDLRQRIIEAGFQLEEFTAVEPYVQKYALMRGEKIFMARRLK